MDSSLDICDLAVGPSAVKIEIRDKPTEGKKLSEMPVIASVRMNIDPQR